MPQTCLPHLRLCLGGKHRATGKLLRLNDSDLRHTITRVFVPPRSPGTGYRSTKRSCVSSCGRSYRRPISWRHQLPEAMKGMDSGSNGLALGWNTFASQNGGGRIAASGTVRNRPSNYGD